MTAGLAAATVGEPDDPDAEVLSESGQPGVRRKLPRPMLATGAAAVVVGVLLGLYVGGLGRTPQLPAPLPTGHPAISTAKATPTPTPVVAAEIADLTARANANTADLTPVHTLVARYVGAFDWSNAAVWQNRLVAAQPGNTDALLLLGVYQFNAADSDGAEKTFLEVTRLAPEGPEAFYNLGYLYLQTSPPAPAKAAAAWQRVVALAPGSEMAQWVGPQAEALAAELVAPSFAPSAKPSGP